MNSTFNLLKNPVNKIINLAMVLALGFLLVVLAGIFSNWLSIVDGIIFAIAYIPVVVAKAAASLTDYDFNFDPLSSTLALAVQELAQFLTAFLVVTGISIPMLLHHSKQLSSTALWLTLIGGLLIFATVYLFSEAFEVEEDVDDLGGGVI